VLFDFWKRLPPEHCVHPDDCSVIRDQLSFVLDIPPGHVNGRLRTAPVVVCYLNPGYEESDRVQFENETNRRALFEQINGDSDFPMWFDRWREWYLPRVRFGDLPDNEIARTVAIFNVCAYASRNANCLTRSTIRRLPSSVIARRYLHEVLIPQARRRERFVIIARGRWAWGLNDSFESHNLRFAPNPRGGHFGSAIRVAVHEWFQTKAREA
jgi:hypothetical protein